MGRERLEMGSAPFTSCLLPGSGLGGHAFLAAVSWVRKEEKSHILWWLYPLGSLPKTLVNEQTVEPSGGRGSDRGLADPAQTGGGAESGRGEALPGPLRVQTQTQGPVREKLKGKGGGKLTC